VLQASATRVLCEVLLPLNVDKRISDFLIAAWPHVLVRAAWRDAQQGGTLLDQYRAVLPELLWSVEPIGAQERQGLIKLLPDLVRRLRAALQSIQLPEDEAKAILDLLVEMHTQVLRAAVASPGRLNLQQLRESFARVGTPWARASWEQSDPPPVRESVVEETFAGIDCEIRVGVAVPASAADRDFLAQTYLLGTRVELRAQAELVPAQLVWISTHRSLYLFKSDAGRFVLYSTAALLEALAEQDVIPLEYAPVFERAVESLLFGAQKLDAPA